MKSVQHTALSVKGQVKIHETPDAEKMNYCGYAYILSSEEEKKEYDDPVADVERGPVIQPGKHVDTLAEGGKGIASELRVVEYRDSQRHQQQTCCHHSDADGELVFGNMFLNSGRLGLFGGVCLMIMCKWVCKEHISKV